MTQQLDNRHKLEKTEPWWAARDLIFAVGIEDTFVPQSHPGARALDEYELTQHYDEWYDDLALAVESGATHVRWGVPWHRVNPARGEFDWEWLDAVVARADELGLELILDLMHYGTPLWLNGTEPSGMPSSGEFAHPEYPDAVATYSAAVAERYRDSISIFTPLNEPLLNVLFCGAFAKWPPYLSGDAGFVTVLGAIAKGIVLAQRAIAEVNAGASFVHVEATFRYESGPGGDAEHDSRLEFLRERQFIVQDLVTGRVGSSHPLRSYLLENGMQPTELDWFLQNAVQPDVMGVNYYPALSTELVEVDDFRDGHPADPRPRVNAWTDGLAEVLTAFADRYGAPVMLTETCWTGTIDERRAWMDASIDEVHRLRSIGLPVVGYTWWSLFDMIEWTWRESTAAPIDHLLDMGLWQLVEQPDGRLARVRTPLVSAFRHHAVHARGEI